MKKQFKNLSLLLIAIACLTSCKTNFYQVYTVETDEAKQEDNSIIFENDECKVYYNLWSNNGKVRFVFSNKTDKDIFINMGQTFFIKNNYAMDYYQGRIFAEHEFVQTATTSGSVNATLHSAGFWSSNLYMEDASIIKSANATKNIKANSYSTTVKEKEIVCVPARCLKVFSYYSASPSLIVTCYKKKDYPTTEADIATYSKDTTPLKFTNRIAYGFTKDDVAEKHIDNTFWISSVKNYAQKAATENVPNTDECKNKGDIDEFNFHFTRPQIRVFKIGGPNKFYQFYQK